MSSASLKLSLFTFISLNAISCVSCPEDRLPDCEPGSQIVERRDEFMCTIVSCEPMREPDMSYCPVYAPLECDEYSTPGYEYDSNGCEIPACYIDHGDYCLSDFIECGPNAYAVSLGEDFAGCEIWACHPSEELQPELVLEPRDPSVVATVTWSADPRYRQENIILSEDQLSVSIEADSVNDTVLAEAFTATGKWYWEVTLNEYHENSYNAIGVCSDQQHTELTPLDGGGVGYVEDGYIMAYDHIDGNVYGEPIEHGDTVGVILDAGSRTVWFIVHGQLIGGGDPVRGIGGIKLDPGYDRWAPCLNMSQGYRYRANFGQEEWVHGQPRGFTIPNVE